MMGGFKKLRVWQDSIELSIIIYKLTNEQPFKNDYGLKDQIRRATVSIASNIAEGEKRNSNKEANRFLFIARGSAAEVITQLNIAYKIGYIRKESFLEYQDLTEKIRASITNLVQSRN